MNRNAVVLILGCVYVLGAAWLVLGEGESYRESLRRERVQAPRAETTPPPPPGQGSAPVATAIETPPNPPHAEAPRPVPTVAVAATPPAGPARAEPASPPPRTTAPEAKPTTTPAARCRPPRLCPPRGRRSIGSGNNRN